MDAVPAALPRTLETGIRMFVGFWFGRADAPTTERVDESLRYIDSPDEILRSVLPGPPRTSPA